MESARLAVVSDLDRIAQLWSDAEVELGHQRGGALLFRSTSLAAPILHSLPEVLIDDDRVLVVGTIDDVVIGFGFARVTHVQADRDPLQLGPAPGDRLGVIEVIYVEEEGRGVGVGEAMLDVLVGRLVDTGCLGFDASALPGNREAKAFFETQGFVTRMLVMHRPAEAHSTHDAGTDPVR